MLIEPIVVMIESLSQVMLSFLGESLIAWCARKQKVVSLSSYESEYRALASAAIGVLWLKSLFDELGYPKFQHTPVIWCDNTGAGSLTSNAVFHARTKHKRGGCANRLRLDVLTKPLSPSRFEVLREELVVKKLPHLI